jgi:hypothetical protein
MIIKFLINSYMVVKINCDRKEAGTTIESVLNNHIVFMIIKLDDMFVGFSWDKTK